MVITNNYQSIDHEDLPVLDGAGSGRPLGALVSAAVHRIDDLVTVVVRYSPPTLVTGALQQGKRRVWIAASA